MIPSDFQMWMRDHRSNHLYHDRFFIKDDYNFLDRDGSLVGPQEYEEKCAKTLEKMRSLFPFPEPSFGVVFAMCSSQTTHDLIGRVDVISLQERYREAYLDFYSQEKCQLLQKMLGWQGMIEKGALVLQLPKFEILQALLPEFPLVQIESGINDREFIRLIREGNVVCSLGEHFLSDMMNLVMPSLMVFLVSSDSKDYAKLRERLSSAIVFVQGLIPFQHQKMQNILYFSLHQALRAILSHGDRQYFLEINPDLLVEEMKNVWIRNETPDFIAKGFLDKYVPKETRPSFQVIMETIDRLK